MASDYSEDLRIDKVILLSMQSHIEKLEIRSDIYLEI